jgi:hypothetical protein
MIDFDRSRDLAHIGSMHSIGIRGRVMNYPQDGAVVYQDFNAK